MANLTIKELPEKIHAELKRAARAEGRSLNSYVLSLLEMSVGERSRRRLMCAGREAFREFLAGLPRLDDSTPILREDRGRGH